jgi:hypothetical protein
MEIDFRPSKDLPHSPAPSPTNHNTAQRVPSSAFLSDSRLTLKLELISPTSSASPPANSFSTQHISPSSEFEGDEAMEKLLEIENDFRRSALRLNR